MIPFNTIPPGSQIFTYHSETNAETIQLAAGLLASFIRSQPGSEVLVHQVPLEDKTYRQLISYSGVERKHLDSVKLTIAAKGPIPLRRLIEPPLMLEWGRDEIPPHLRTHTIADGNHRICALYELGWRYALVYLVPEILWREFLISNMPSAIEARTLELTRNQEGTKP
jgi:hypothetical protein